MEDSPHRLLRPAIIRTVAAVAFALAFSGGVYLLLQATRPDGGTRNKRPHANTPA